MWTGGLAFVVLALVLAREERWPLATKAVPRFSTLAVGAVGVLIVAGAINGYLQVRVWHGLWETTYGLLLLAKIALVLPLLALGAFNNRYAVPRLRQGIASAFERRRFLRAVTAELALMTVIVGRHRRARERAARAHGRARARRGRGGRRARAARGARHGRSGDGRARTRSGSS